MKTVDTDEMDKLIEQVLVEVTDCLSQVPGESLAQAGAMIAGASRIFVAGAGRSGLALQALAMRLMHLGKTVHVVGETTTPAIRIGDLLVLGSASGRTDGLLLTAEQARYESVKILLFTTDRSSPLAELADYHVIIPAPSLKMGDQAGGVGSVQPMGTLFEQSLLILCDTLILGLMQQFKVDAGQMVGRHANLE